MADHGGSGRRYVAGCRCLECRAANTARVNRRKAERRALVEAGEIPVEVRHGLDSTYNNWSCRCEPCRAAHSVEMSVQYWRRKTSAEVSK